MSDKDFSIAIAVCIAIALVVGYAAGRGSVQGGHAPSGDPESEILGD